MINVGIVPQLMKSMTFGPDGTLRRQAVWKSFPVPAGSLLHGDMRIILSGEGFREVTHNVAPTWPISVGHCNGQ